MDCIPEERREALFDEIGEIARPGDLFALEFRGLIDQTLTAHHTASCGRHVVDANTVRDELDAIGFEIIADEESDAWERRGKNGVFLHRIVAKKA